jgi:hypothetical protein
MLAAQGRGIMAAKCAHGASHGQQKSGERKSAHPAPL